jgi:hypothetical protein
MLNIDILTIVFNYLTLKDRCILGYCNKYLQKTLRYIKYDKIIEIYNQKQLKNVKKWKNIKFNLLLLKIIDKDIFLLDNVNSITSYKQCIENINPNVNKIDITKFNNTSIFNHLKCLKIYDNYHLNDNDLQIISHNKNLRKLKIDKCPEITDISMFGYLHKLDLTRCKRINKIRFHKSLPNKLKLIQNNNITDFTGLDGIKHLHISDDNLNNIRFNNIYYIRLEWCINLKTIISLKNINNIKIISCYKLKYGLNNLKNKNIQVHYSTHVSDYLLN